MRQAIRVHLPSGESVDMIPNFTFRKPDGTVASDAIQNVALREVMQAIVPASALYTLEVVQVF
jgi:hypothetical protein